MWAIKKSHREAQERCIITKVLRGPQVFFLLRLIPRLRAHPTDPTQSQSANTGISFQFSAATTTTTTTQKIETGQHDPFKK